ncbi:transposon protein [Striga asiatica]|uniref:Transposon protein n=1 Tax=Striga asiatica TaxID=4170 RepID=A0A5A7RIC7_STRAF|nr:transposon protein [Striga asiatica]
MDILTPGNYEWNFDEGYSDEDNFMDGGNSSEANTIKSLMELRSIRGFDSLSGEDEVESAPILPQQREWLATKVVEDLRDHSNMTCEELKAHIAEQYNVTTSIAKAYRVKAYALQLLDGNVAEQYSRLWDYRGLVAALEEIYPSPYHRFCVRHVYSNIEKKWEDELVRSLFWLAAISTTNHEFDAHMNKMKEKDLDAWEHLTSIGAQRWSRAHFQAHVKCHVFSSSIVECFNGVIKKYRDNPVVILLDDIKIKTMTLMRKKKEKMRRKGGLICPEVPDKLNGFIMESSRWQVASCGEVLFEVTLRPQRAYEHEINPMTGPNFWPKKDNESIQPPLLKQPPEMPKKLRHKSSLEGKDPHKAKRKYGVIKCGKCGGSGHNKRSCKESEQSVSFFSQQEGSPNA